MPNNYNQHYHTASVQSQQPYTPCPQLPGTVLRIFIPAGAVINLLNILELTSPTGICLIVRIPLLEGNSSGLQSLFDAIKQAGGRVEVSNS